MFASCEAISKNKFTYNDDRKLKKWVRILGADWKSIAEKMRNKNARQCKDRWEKYLAPSVNNSPYTIDEDILILKYYKMIGAKWVEMSKYIPGRSDVSLKSRYKLLMRHGKTQEMLEKVKSNMIKVASEEIIDIDATFAQIDDFCANFDDVFATFE